MMHAWSTPEGRHNFSFENLQKACREILGALDEHDRISSNWSEPAPPAEEIPGPSRDQKAQALPAKRRRLEAPPTATAPTRGLGRPKGHHPPPHILPRNCIGPIIYILDDAPSAKPDVASASNANHRL